MNSNLMDYCCEDGCRVGLLMPPQILMNSVLNDDSKRLLLYGFPSQKGCGFLHDTDTCRCHHVIPQYNNPKELSHRQFLVQLRSDLYLQHSSWSSQQVLVPKTILLPTPLDIVVVCTFLCNEKRRRNAAWTGCPLQGVSTKAHTTQVTFFTT